VHANERRIFDRKDLAKAGLNFLSVVGCGQAAVNVVAGEIARKSSDPSVFPCVPVAIDCPAWDGLLQAHAVSSRRERLTASGA